MREETYEEWCERKLVTELATNAATSVRHISVDEVRSKIENKRYRIIKSEDELTKEVNEQAWTMREQRNLWVKDLIVQAVKLNRGDAKRVAAKLECEDLPTLIAECWDDDTALNIIELTMSRCDTSIDWEFLVIIAVVSIAGLLTAWGVATLVSLWLLS